MSSIQSENPTTVTPLPALAKVLSQRLECPVELWEKGETWFRVASTHADQGLSDHLVHSALKGQKLSDPLLFPVENDETLFFLPLDNSNCSAHLLAGVTTVRRAELLRDFLSQQAQISRLEEQREDQLQQLELYAAQVTADFEEMAWLRTLADQVNKCTVEHSLESITLETLGMLLDLIHCRTVVLVQPAPEPSESDYVFRMLGDEVPEESCHFLVEKWNLMAEMQPVVCNGGKTSPCGLNSPAGVRSFILAPIMKDGRTYGWLMAVNKVKQDNSAVRSHFYDTLEYEGEDRPAELEFGTSEATLLRSTVNMLATHARNLEMFANQEELLIGVIRTMMNSLDAKDPYTCGHSDRVATYSRIIALKMGLSEKEAEQIFTAGLVHDIGKVGVPDHILKKPDRLTDEEFAEIKKHPEIGYNILKHIKAFSYVLPGVLHHHEALDGSGYPAQLKGDEIPLMARIMAVADAYDAMTSTRPYRDGMPIRKSVKILLEGSGTQWDPRCVDAFLDAIEQIIEVTIDSEQQKERFMQKYAHRDHALRAEIESVQEAVAIASRV